MRQEDQSKYMVKASGQQLSFNISEWALNWPQNKKKLYNISDY